MRKAHNMAQTPGPFFLSYCPHPSKVCFSIWPTSSRLPLNLYPNKENTVVAWTPWINSPLACVFATLASHCDTANEWFFSVQ